MMATPPEFIDFIDANADKFIGRLADAVKIHSVSGDRELRGEVIAMGDWLNDQLKGLGVTTKRVDLGPQTENVDDPLHLPPAILGRIGDDPNKKTVLIYGHYDVQPAKQEDGWSQDPFTLTEDDTHRLIGRGSTDDKGPVLGWLNVLEAHKTLGLDLPVNLRFCFEGMEENGSEGLDTVIESEAADPQG
ncbi:hypothetical protein C8Q74DRAFT_1370039 [Fomes fomentarius]|nr:hypothetical protein C8Q74DRAFT_1370039 [Fomes fomentarius]